MDNHFKPLRDLTEEDMAEWTAWSMKLPEHVRKIAELFPPWYRYRCMVCNEVCTVISYPECPHTQSASVRVFDGESYCVRLPEELGKILDS